MERRARRRFRWCCMGRCSSMERRRVGLPNLDVKGHLQATNAGVRRWMTTDVLIDSVVADAEYSPNSGVVVASSTIKRGTAVLNVRGRWSRGRW